jgi:hypothetical protein
MAYTKLLVDNPTCNRRFHVTFDDEAETLPRVEIHCQQCGLVVYAADHHPPAQLARVENLTKTSALSEHLVFACAFEDTLSQRTIPEYKGRDVHVYPAANPRR